MMAQNIPGPPPNSTRSSTSASVAESYESETFSARLDSATYKVFAEAKPLSLEQMNELINSSLTLTDDQKTAYKEILNIITDSIDVIKNSPEASSSQTQSLISDLEMKISMQTIIYSTSTVVDDSQPSFWDQLGDAFSDAASDCIPWID